MGQAAPPSTHVELCFQAAARVRDERISRLKDCILIKAVASDVHFGTIDMWSVSEGRDERFIYNLFLGVPSVVGESKYPEHVHLPIGTPRQPSSEAIQVCSWRVALKFVCSSMKDSQASMKGSRWPLGVARGQWRGCADVHVAQWFLAEGVSSRISSIRYCPPQEREAASGLT